MNDTTSGDNVTPIRPGHPSQGEPDWLKTANQLGRDVADEGTPAALDDDLEPVLRESLEARGVPYPMAELIPSEKLLQRGQAPKSRALSAIERAEQEAEVERRQIALDRETARLQYEAKIDSKRVEPMSADTRGIQWTVLIGVTLIGAAAFAISYGAVYEVAGWTGWASWQMMLTPLLFDAGIIVFTFLSFIRMERGQSVTSTFALAELLTVLSSIAQVIHTLSISPRTGMELVVACVISAIPPLILSAASYLAGRTIFRMRVAR